MLTHKVEKTVGASSLVPLFISCDPKRDSIESLQEYLKGDAYCLIPSRFSSKIYGLIRDSWTNTQDGKKV
jgi:SCO1/SenC